MLTADFPLSLRRICHLVNILRKIYLVDLPLQLCDRRSVSLSSDTFRQQRLLQLLHSLFQALLQQ